MTLLERWKRLLSYFVLAMLSVNTSASSDQAISPVSATYTHHLIERAQALRSQEYVSLLRGMQRFNLHWDHRGVPITANLCLLSPWMILEGGIDTKVEHEFIALLCRNREGYTFRCNEKIDTVPKEILLDSLRLNVILGSLYQYPAYLRFARDYLPFGYSVSDAIAPQNMSIRNIMLDSKDWIGEIGGRLSGSQYEVRGSLAATIQREVTANLQYETTRQVQMTRRLAINRSVVGGGLTFLTVKLLNLYSHIHLSSNTSFRMELIRPWHTWGPVVSLFHCEVSQYFKPISIIGSHIPWALVFGSTKGYRYAVATEIEKPPRGPFTLEQFVACRKTHNKIDDIAAFPELHSNLFGAAKFNLWKHRITLLGGAQYGGIINNKGQDAPKKGWAWFFKVGVSL